MIPPPDSPEGAMLRFIRKRAVASLISLVGLIVMVFFLSRLTGDPAALFLPVPAFSLYCRSIIAHHPWQSS